MRIDYAKIQKLLEMITRGQLEVAIDEALKLELDTTHRNVVTTIASQYALFRVKKIKGILTTQEVQLFENQISARMVDWIRSVEEKNGDSAIPIPTTWWKYVASYFAFQGIQPSDDGIANAILGSSHKLKQLAIVFAVLVIVSGGILLASTWPFGRKVFVEPPAPSQLCMGYVGIITDSEGNPQKKLTAKLASGRILPTKTDHNGVLNLWEFLSADQLSDTLQLFREGRCIYQDVIRFPDMDYIVLDNNLLIQDLDSNKSDPPIIDSCKLGKNYLDTTIELKGNIYAESDPDELGKPNEGIPNIHVFVNRKGCIKPISEAWTDEKGNYTLILERGLPFPEYIIVDGFPHGYSRVSERFIPSRPNFHFPLKKLL